MVDKLVIDEMWEFLNTQITAKYAKTEMTTMPVLGEAQHQAIPATSGITQKILTFSKKNIANFIDVKVDVPLVRRGRPPNKPKADAAQIKEYTAFLKTKIKKMGRMPTQEENKKFYAEFTRLKTKAVKRKADDEDRDWTANTEKKPKLDKSKKSMHGLIGKWTKSRK